MITEIELKNFRSILHDKVSFKPLTVIIGANGSGKSNLIKSLEFLSIIASEGVLEAVNSFGGFSALVPKAIAEDDVRKAKVSMRIVADSPQLRSKSSATSIPTSEHFIELAHSPSQGVRIPKEEIVFRNVFEVLDSFNDVEGLHEVPSDVRRMAQIQISRQGRKKPSLQFMPDFPTYGDLYAAWLGYRYFPRKLKPKSLLELEKFTGRYGRPSTKRGTFWSYKSLLEPEAEVILSRAYQMIFYKRDMANIRRYDLLLNELRDEQKAGDRQRLNSSGTNMPSVLKGIKKDKAAWERVLTTMEAINPSVNNLVTSSLRTGKQYVDFLEKTSKQSVESWQMSDGTLRALAIILALETHPSHSTILIEEPEQNLHPWASEPLIRHMRELINQNDLQVILTTHSKHILEAVSPDEVLVASRSSERGTFYSSIKDLFPDRQLLTGEVGEMWVRGLLGGHPNYD